MPAWEALTWDTPVIPHRMVLVCVPTISKRPQGFQKLCISSWKFYLQYLPVSLFYWTGIIENIALKLKEAASVKNKISENIYINLHSSLQTILLLPRPTLCVESYDMYNWLDGPWET